MFSLLCQKISQFIMVITVAILNLQLGWYVGFVTVPHYLSQNYNWQSLPSIIVDPTSANIRAASPATDSALTRRHTTASVVSPSRIPLHAPSKHHSRTIFQPIHLHQTTGRCIALNADKTVATRHSAEYSNAYIFTERPLYLAEKLVIQVMYKLC